MLDQVMPGPCCICGATNYRLSVGGPTICPKCDCGNFDAATVLAQAKVMEGLRAENERLRALMRQQADEAVRLCREIERLRAELAELKQRFILKNV